MNGKKALFQAREVAHLAHLCIEKKIKGRKGNFEEARNSKLALKS